MWVKILEDLGYVTERFYYDHLFNSCYFVLDDFKSQDRSLIELGPFEMYTSFRFLMRHDRNSQDQYTELKDHPMAIWVRECSEWM